MGENGIKWYKNGQKCGKKITYFADSAVAMAVVHGRG
jgi:hypothetical protein